MKRMLALLLTAMLILTLLPGCGKKDPGGDAPEVPENPTEQGGETPDVTPEPEPYVDPYEAVRTYWSEDQLTQSWGPDQIVEHLFFHPVIAYPQWAFHDCGASQSERYGLDDWMVTADEYAKILQSVYEKGYILVAIEDVWSEVTDESGTHMVRNTLKLPEGKKPSDVWNAALKRLAREAVACFAIINQGKFGGYAEGTYKLIFPATPPSAWTL